MPTKILMVFPMELSRISGTIKKGILQNNCEKNLTNNRRIFRRNYQWNLESNHFENLLSKRRKNSQKMPKKNRKRVLFQNFRDHLQKKIKGTPTEFTEAMFKRIAGGIPK